MSGPAAGRRAAWSLALICSCLALSACDGQDWRARAIADAEARMRTEVNDPSARFAQVQVTGNSRTGQTCGFVDARSGSGRERTGRFIVYIDGTAGPFVEADMGSRSMSAERFDFAWRNDCLKEGYLP
jgi:hypothetical protein